MASSSSSALQKRARSTRVSVISKSMRVVDSDTRREAIERHLRSLELDNPGDSIDNYDGGIYILLLWNIVIHIRVNHHPFHYYIDDDDYNANEEEGSRIKEKREKSKIKTTDVGLIRTDAPEGTRFLVLRDNHSATTP